jgi:hypothetical protein
MNRENEGGNVQTGGYRVPDSWFLSCYQTIAYTNNHGGGRTLNTAESRNTGQVRPFQDCAFIEL